MLAGQVLQYKYTGEFRTGLSLSDVRSPSSMSDGDADHIKPAQSKEDSG
jgi:hypothetical protein